jgi:TetR/AcrR family transcriptional repressor of nem operon
LVGTFIYQPVGASLTPTETKLESRRESKTRFLDAALHVFRTKGYSATRVEDICETAGVTKGSFFHHFDMKEAPAMEAADYWTEAVQCIDHLHKYLELLFGQPAKEAV